MINFKDLLIYCPIIGVGGGGGGGVTIKNQNKTITENGTYTADSGYTGLGRVEVNVQGGGGGASVTTVGGWEGTPLPTDGQIGTVYYNNNLSTQEVVDLVIATINPNGEEFVEYSVAKSQEYPDAEFISVQTGALDGENAVIIMESFVDVETDDLVEIPVFMFGPEVANFPFQGWNPGVDFTFNFNVSNSAVYGEKNNALSPIFSSTPFVLRNGETIQLTGEYDGATVKAEEGGDIDVKAMLDEKKLPLTIKAPQKAVALKEGDFLPGTTVPNEGYVENIYVNTALSNEEVAEILSGMDYLLFNSYHGTTGDVVISNNTDKTLVIQKGWGRTEVSYVDPTLPDGMMLIWSSEEGWGGILNHGSVLTFNSNASTNTEMIVNQYYEYTGTIGAQNNKLNVLFSTTPFERDEGESLILSGEYDGAPLKISKSVDLYSLIKNEKKIPFTLELQIWNTYQDIDYLISDNICYFKSNIDQYFYVDYDSIPWKDVTEAYILPKTKRISSQSFRNCSNLTEIEISNTVEYIEELAFAGCTSLKNAVIPDSVIGMGDAFSGCTSLQSVVIKCTNFETLGRMTFFNCTSLTDISLPSSITRIEYSAFENCTNLTNIYYGGTMEQWNAISKGSGWDKNTGNYTIHCTDGDIAKS